MSRSYMLVHSLPELRRATVQSVQFTAAGLLAADATIATMERRLQHFGQDSYLADSELNCVVEPSWFEMRWAFSFHFKCNGM